MHDHRDCISALDKAKAALERGDHAEGRAHVGRAMAALKGKAPKAEHVKLASRLKQITNGYRLKP